MSKESQPQDYKFKHAKHISMDGYKGVAGDLMQLNHPVTDGFMQATDMRSNIEIINAPQDRVADYDQIGSVRVGKFLRLPRLDLWHQDGAINTRRENGAWLLAVNDQKLSQEILQKQDQTNGKRFDEVFTKRFEQEIAKGIENCLKKEKLLNNGNYYNLSFLFGYKTLIVWDLLYPALSGVEMIASGENPTDILMFNVIFLSGVNAAYNLCNLVLSGVRKKALELNSADGNTLPNYQDPLVKHHILEYVAPPIAVDRVARGLAYMKLHGKELIVPR